MPSSWMHAIPVVCNYLANTQPRAVLDIGVGNGKYGLLAKEYGHAQIVDGVEADQSYINETVHAIYRKLWINDVRTMYKEIPANDYNLIIMADVIEHMSKEDGFKLLDHFTGCPILITTPDMDYPQHDDEHPFENHVSRWTEGDFAKYGPYQRLHDPGDMALIVVVRP